MITRSIGFLAAAVGLCAVAVAAPNPPGEAPTPDSARAALAKWVETQQLIAKERQEWEQGKTILQSRIEAVRGEIATMTQRLDDARRAASEANAKKAGDVAESSRLQQSGMELGTWASELESGLRTLEGRLPDPLVQKVKPLYDRMPADSGSTTISLAERYQNVVGILNEIGKFNNDITMVTEVRTLSDGKPAEVRTVYLGLAQAYFVSAKGDAGIGRPGAHGWEWTSAGAIAPEVTEAVEMLQNKAKPKFVTLPVTVQ